MAFSKTSVSVTMPHAVVLPATADLEIGTEKRGKVWDGKHWVLKSEWEARQIKG